MTFPGKLSLFAAAAPGLEDTTALELSRLGVGGVMQVPGGVEFSGDIRTIYHTNLWSRTAQRILVRLDGFFAVHLAKLHAKLKKVPWEMVLDPSKPVVVRATCRKSRIYHSVAAAERGAKAIQERLGTAETPMFGEGAPSERFDGATVILRLERDHCTVSLDSSGDHLHRRGYRTHRYEAPMRENLAAAMLLRCGFEAPRALWDPTCGSGTVPIEAAMMAARIPPGINRRFAFMDWPAFDEALWQTLKTEAASKMREPTVLIGGSDRNESAVWMSRQHAKAAGVDAFVRFDVAGVADLSVPGDSGLLFSNPPYGKRIGERKRLRGLYHQLGELTARHGDGWQLGLVTTDPTLAAATGLDIRPSSDWFPNGGIRIRLFCTVA